MAAPAKPRQKQQQSDAVLDLRETETVVDVAALEGMALPAPPPEPGQDQRGPFAALRALNESVGDISLLPLFLLLGLSAVERFDAIAFGVLSPELQKTFHLNDAKLATISGLTAALPILLSVPLGYLADRVNRVRLAQIAAFIWGVTAVFTGLAPIVLIFVLARLVGGVGLLVNEPVHPSLLSDWYPPESLTRVNSWHRQAGTIGLIGGPLAGALGAVFGWRSTFVILAIPTFVLAVMLSGLKEPARGGLAALAGLKAEKPPGVLEAFRRIRSIRSLRRTWLAAFFFGSGTLPFATFLNLYLKHVFHTSDIGRGFVAAVFGGAGAIGLVLATRAVTRAMGTQGVKALPLVNGGMVVVLGVGVLLMAAAPNLPLATVFSVVAGIGATGFLPPYLTMVAFVTPPALRSQAFSWSLLFYALGALTFSGVIGNIADQHGERVAFVYLAALVIAGGITELTVRGFVERDVEQSTKQETTSKSKAMLAVSGLDVAYDQVQVLFGVDLEVEDGEIVALLGTNGAGKSTLLKAISGLIDPIGGSMFLDGRDITHADANATARLGIVQMPGGRGVFPTLTVGENMRVAGWLFRKDPAYVKQATERALEYFPVLRKRWDTAAGSLSGGEQQMLSLAQAFIGKPKLLCIDELSLGLAPSIVDRLLEIVEAIHAQGTTVILVEQSVNTALRIAKRAVFMEKGEVRFSGPTAELLERPDVLRAVFLKGAAAAAEANEDGTAKPRARVSKAAAKRAADADHARRAELLTRPLSLETVGITKRYGGIDAVRDVSLEVHEGQVVGLIGPNGAGKTTIFDLISGFTPMNGGRVMLHGEDVTDRSATQRAALGLGRSFQDARLWTSLTVSECLAVAFERHLEIRAALPAVFNLPIVDESEAETQRRVAELVEVLGLNAFRDKFIGELSTGSRRMVEIAAILAHRPSVLILDEPSSGIAQKETEGLGPLLREVQRHIGCSLLVIEHDMPLITGLADHLYALEEGQVIAFGTPNEVLHHPRVVEAYLGTAAGDESQLLTRKANGTRRTNGKAPRTRTQ
ncbi:MAG TPA: MFS transporter [Acidimicrobiales bacterium]|nr:MFS transporter [Acidimicrobiales bacterium]